MENNDFEFKLESYNIESKEVKIHGGTYTTTNLAGVSGTYVEMKNNVTTIDIGVNKKTSYFLGVLKNEKREKFIRIRLDFYNYLENNEFMEKKELLNSIIQWSEQCIESKNTNLASYNLMKRLTIVSKKENGEVFSRVFDRVKARNLIRQVEANNKISFELLVEDIRVGESII